MSGEMMQLVLRPVSRLASGESVEALRLEGRGPLTVGRSSDADWVIADPAVSRRHVGLVSRDGVWFITDLGSRHGTTVSGKKLVPDDPIELRAGDDISLGAFRCRCEDTMSRATMTTPFADGLGAPQSISVIDTARLTGIAQRGLDALLELTADLDTAREIERVAAAVSGAVRVATGCPRVVVARPVSESDVEVLASTVEDPPRLSRSLMDAASSEGLVELRTSGGGIADQAQSIVQLEIRSAICAAIVAGGSPAAYLMVDTRAEERSIPADAAAFCQSVARLAGLAIERIGAAELAARHEQLRRDLDAARRAQEQLSPPSRGSQDEIGYVFECIPGRVVAGDFFDFFGLGKGRAAFVLGDVSGKGVGAAMLMASTQSQLRMQLMSGASLAASLAAVSDDLSRRSADSKFVTLFASVIDVSAGTAEFVDAGHGFAVLRHADGGLTQLDLRSGFPLGVTEGGEYETRVQRFGSGDQVVVFSDGAVEQPGQDGSQLGIDPLLGVIQSASRAEDVVGALIGCVQEHASGGLADDLTVASVGIGVA